MNIQHRRNSKIIRNEVHPDYLEVLEPELLPALIEEGTIGGHHRHSLMIPEVRSGLSSRGILLSATFLISLLGGVLLSKIDRVESAITEPGLNEQQTSTRLEKTSASKYVTMMKQKVTPRELPDIQSKAMNVLAGGTLCVLLRARDDWYEILSPQGQRAWIQNKDADIVEQ